MKASFPIHYVVNYKPVRCVKDRQVHFASEASVEFRIVPRTAVRTVMRAVKLGKGDGAKVKAWSFGDPLTPKPGGGMREIVKFDGDLWIEAMPAAEVIEGLEKHGGRGTPFVEPYAGHGLILDVNNPNLQQHQRPVIYSDRRQIERMERAELRTFDDDGGDEMRLDLLRIADALVAIDGTLYARFREPMLKIGSRHSDESATDFCGSRDGSHISAPKYARDDGYIYDDEVAMLWSLSEEAAGRAEWLRKGKREIRAGVAYEVLDPDLLTACPHVNAFLYLATAALKALYAHPMALRHGVLERAVELRDALSTCDDQITPRLRRAIDEVARIEPLSEEEAETWRRRAEGRPRMLTYNGRHHDGGDLPLTRASQIVTHAGEHLKAAELAASALRRLATRNPRLSWEERALETNSLRDGAEASYELLSSEAVADRADNLGVDFTRAIRAARDDGARIFMVGMVGARMKVFAPSLLAIVDEAPDGSLSVRDVLHGNDVPEPTALALLDRHLATAAPVAELHFASAPGM
jgi:hypothetical protein